MMNTITRNARKGQALGLALSLLAAPLAQADSRWFIDADFGVGNFTDSPSGEHYELHEVGKPGIGGVRVGKTFAVGKGHQARAYVVFESHNVEADSTQLGLTWGAKRDTGLFGVGGAYEHTLGTGGFYLSGRGELGWYTDALEVYSKDLATNVKTSRSYDSKGNFATLGLGLGYRFNDNWHSELGARR